MERQDFVLTNRNGKRMPATLRTPEGDMRGTCVLAHGLGGWKDQGIVAALADAVVSAGYRVLTFDAADGANAPDAEPLRGTTTSFLEDLEDVVNEVHQSSWHEGPLLLAGHSLGGLISARYAATHPGIEKLILVAPALTWKTYRKFVLPIALLWLITGSFKMPGPDMRGYRLGRPWLFDFAKWNAYATASKTSLPTLIIAADNDGLVGTVATHERYAKLFPNATFEVVPDTDHDFDRHLPAVAAIVTKWLTSS